MVCGHAVVKSARRLCAWLIFPQLYGLVEKFKVFAAIWWLSCVLHVDVKCPVLPVEICMSMTFDPVGCVLCLSGGPIQQNGHTTAEIQEEVALTNMGTIATTEKRHSHVNNDKLHFPRANLQTITTLGRLIRYFSFVCITWERMSSCSDLIESERYQSCNIIVPSPNKTRCATLIFEHLL